MKLLLDTHAALWWMSGDDRFGATAERLITSPDTRVLLSAVVVWEVTIKRALGKLEAPDEYAELLLRGGATGLPISLVHAAGVGALPSHHADPFDRLLIAQAVAEHATIVSRDEAFGAYDVAVAW